MRLGLDIHGVIDTYTDQMIKLAQDVLDNGGRVYIITGPPVEVARKELAAIMAQRLMTKPFWSQVFSIVDWMKLKNIPHYTKPDGTVWALREHDWNAVKGQIAVELSLDLHIDDSPQYGEYFPPGVFVLMPKQIKKD